jgi:hypothetical protein
MNVLPTLPRLEGFRWSRRSCRPAPAGSLRRFKEAEPFLDTRMLILLGNKQGRCRLTLLGRPVIAMDHGAKGLYQATARILANNDVE